MANQGGNLKSTSINGCRTYYITGQRSNATWLDPKKIRALRKDTDYQQRVELVQDLRFETATTRIKVSPDGEFLIASGIYPPQVKVYELREMALKFERHLISEIVDFEILSDDYSKMAFLCADRSINLHAKYGSHFSLRVPRMGRDLAYDPWSCDLLCAASSPELYRINLEQGRFLSSLSTRSPALNVVTRSKLHGLIACGGEDGAVECFDFRTKSSVGRINSAEHAGDTNQEVTALQFDGDGGYQMAVGTSDGKVLVYDLRSSHPTRVKDHMYGSPILDIKWHQTLNSEGTKLITTDSHIVRIWDPETGDNITSIEPTGGTINDICVFDKSGLMLLALDGMQIPCYFTPALGPAPKWCSYLEHLTEELEENPQATIYDDFKFLTSEELERLNLTNLIGTNLLRAYMHGYFIDHRLYKKAKSLANPFEYEQYIEEHKKKKLEEQRGSRITKKLPRLPKVNPKLAEKFLLDGEAEEDNVEVDDPGADKKRKRKKGIGAEIMKDPRFDLMFKNKDFEVEEQSQEYLSLHPMPSSKRKPRELVEEHFVPVDEDLRSSDSDSSEAAESSDDELNKDKRKKARVPKLYEAKDERHADAFVNNRSLANDDILPIGERVAALPDQYNSRSSRDVKLGPGGSREISFISRSSAKYKEDKEEEREGKRRGIQSLGFQSDRSDSGGRGRGRGGRGRGGGRGGGGRGRGRGGGGGFRGKSRGRGRRGG
ncbi:hypothetical protein MKX01_003370 [Papaver californicum]|nr:hypothetical protein MKX01_003370 [Papaver californicum]